MADTRSSEGRAHRGVRVQLPPWSLDGRCPGGEKDIMAPSEGAGPGSTPGRGTDGCPRSVPAARDRAKVEGEARLLTGIQVGLLLMVGMV